MEPTFSLTSESLILKCNSEGAPSTTTLWSKDGTLLLGMDGMTTTSSSLEMGAIRYSSALVLKEEETGLFSCDVYSEWMRADKAISGRKRELTSPYKQYWRLNRI